jgi:imidazolonepropionase-like amidohydrolase
MRLRPLIPVTLLLCGIVARETVPAAHAQLGAGSPLAITGVTLIDVRASGPLSARRDGQTVIVDRGIITHIGPAATASVPPGVQRVDGLRRYLIPGLWDAHAHLSSAGPSALPAYVATGITTVRDLGGRIADFRAWEQEIRDGTLVAPRMFKAGPNIEGAWWLDPALMLIASDPALSRFPMLEFSPRERLDGPQDARRAVAALAAHGVDVIKFRNLRAGEFRAVAGEAKPRNLPLVGHVPRGVSIGEAAEQGLQSLEHAESVTLSLGDANDAERRVQFTRVASSGAAITPTLVSDVAYRLTSDDVARSIVNDTSNRLDSRRRYIARQLLDAWTFGLETVSSPRLTGPSHTVVRSPTCGALGRLASDYSSVRIWGCRLSILASVSTRNCSYL